MFMLTFGIIAANLTLIAIAFVVFPLLKKNTATTGVDRNTLNVAIYKERLIELEQESLTPAQLKQAKSELEKTLAQDLDNTDPQPLQTHMRWASVMMVVLGIPLLATGGYWKLGAWQSLMHAQTTTAATTAPQQQQQNAHSKTGAANADFEKMVQNLEARLQKDPKDADGWNMLARSYAYLKRYDQAVQAYNKVLALGGDQDPEILTELARMLILQNSGQFEGQPTLLLKSALNLDPQNQQALWLLGLGANEQGEYTDAIGYWQRFLQQIPLDEQKSRKMLEERIAQARTQLSHMTAPVHAPVSSESSTTNTQIEVSLTLAPSLQNKLKPDDTVFVYARAITGSAMPLAIVKEKASALPLTIILDDSMAMMPSLQLSNFKEVMVLARISRSGSARLQTGDLQGQVSPVIIEKNERVHILINQIAP